MIYKKGMYVIKRNMISGTYIAGKLVSPAYEHDPNMYDIYDKPHKEYWLIEVVQNNGYGVGISNGMARIICPTHDSSFAIEVYNSYSEFVAKVL